MRTGSGGPRLQRPRLSFQNVLSSFVDPVSERSSQTKAAAPLTCSAKAPTGPPRPPPSAECPRSIRCRSGCCPYLLESPDSQGPAPEPPRCALPSPAPCLYSAPQSSESLGTRLDKAWSSPVSLSRTAGAEHPSLPAPMGPMQPGRPPSTAPRRVHPAPHV